MRLLLALSWCFILATSTHGSHKVTVYPNDTVSLPLSDFVTDIQGDQFESSDAGVTIKSGWMLAGDIHAELDQISDITQVVRPSKEVMGFVSDHYILSYLSVAPEGDEARVRGVVQFTKAKGSVCYDALIDEVNDRMMYVCYNTEDKAARLYFIDVKYGKYIEEIHVNLPADFNIGKGLQLRLINFMLFGSEYPALIIFGTAGADPFISICTKVTASKLKETSCEQHKVDLLDTISSIELNPLRDGLLFAGLAKNSKNIQVLLECEEKCKVLSNIEDGVVTIVRHSYRYQLVLVRDANVQICEYVRFGGRLECKGQTKLQTEKRVYIKQAEHSEHNKIAVVLSDFETGEYAGWGNLYSILRRVSFGKKDTFGMMFNNSFIYLDHSEKGLLFITYYIDATIVIEAAKIKDDSTELVKINQRGTKDVLLELSIEKLSTSQLEPTLPELISPVFLTNPKLCLSRYEFRGQSLKFEFEDKSKLIENVKECQGQNGGIIAAGDDWILTNKLDDLNFYDCKEESAYDAKHDESKDILSCTVAFSDEDIHITKSMELVAANRIDSRGFYLGMTNKRIFEVVVIFNGIVKKISLKGHLLEMHGVSYIDHDLSNITPYIALRTDEQVFVIRYTVKDQNLQLVNILDVECPVAIEITNMQLRIAEGCKSNKLKVYNVPFNTNKTEVELKLPSDITIAGMCILSDHILLAHSPGLLNGDTVPAASQIRLYPLALLGKMPAVQPQYLPVPVPSSPITKVRCMSNKSGYSILAKGYGDSLLFIFKHSAFFIRSSNSPSFLTRSGRMALWSETEIEHFDPESPICFKLNKVSEGDETIRFKMTDIKNQSIHGKVQVDWVDQRSEIRLSKINHEVIAMGEHDIDNLVDIDGIVRYATIEEKKNGSATIIPSLSVLKAYGIKTANFNSRTYNDIMFDGRWTFAVFYNETDNKKSTQMDVFIDDTYQYTVSLPVSAKLGSVAAYAPSQNELYVFLDGLDHSRSGLSSFYRLYYKEISAVPIAEPEVIYLDTPEGFTGIMLSGDYLYFLSHGEILPLAVSNLQYQPRIRVKSSDLTVAAYGDMRVIVSVLGYSIDIVLISQDATIIKRKHVTQEKSILLTRPSCLTVDLNGFSCVFKTSGAYIVEMTFDWNDLNESIYYHMINTGYEVIQVLNSAEYVVAKVKGDRSLKKSNEIQIWKSGKAKGHGKVIYMFELESQMNYRFGQIPEHSIYMPMAVRKYKEDNPTPAFIALANPTSSVSILFLKADHLKVNVITSDIDKKETLVVLHGLSNTSMSLQYLQKREDNKPPTPSGRGRVGTVVWIIMIILIVASLIGILLILLYSINSHRATLYDRSEQESSYSRYDETIPQFKADHDGDAQIPA